MMKTHIAACGVCLVVATLAGCGGSSSNNDGAPPTPPISSAAACTALGSTKIAATSIGAPSNGATVASATLVAASSTAGEYCQVNGTIAPVDVTAPNINFEFNSLTFDPLNPGTYQAQVQQVSAESDATNPDLSAFIAKGGKAIITHGLADEIVSTDSSVDYYNALVQKFGQASVDSFVRST
jgi:Tannase and feruloyl esterase